MPAAIIEGSDQYPEQQPFYLKERQRKLLLHPDKGILEDKNRIYKDGDYVLGWPMAAKRIYEGLVLNNTHAIVGVQLGDEGKGRLVDNVIESMIPGIKLVYVDRFNGGSNAGHTVEKGGVKVALHQVPSSVMYTETVGIMDRGMVIHVEDLSTEVEYAEKKTSQSLKDRLYLSRDALMVTDLDRAEELLLSYKSGKSRGTTGRGIGPGYAHHYDHTGLKIKDLLADNWEEKVGKKYDQMELDFTVHPNTRGEYTKLADVGVADFKGTLEEEERLAHDPTASKHADKSKTRPLGSKQEFISRLKSARQWLLDRNMVKDTYIIHRENMDNINNVGMLFEGGQALGLHPWLGTLMDTTASETGVRGVETSSGLWRVDDIRNRIGVFKATYMSSVGYRQMPTKVDIGETTSPNDLEKYIRNPTDDQKWAAWVRDFANEFGTTTGRPRDICHLDLALMGFNCWLSGSEVLAATHLDVARKNEEIKVCTHYTDSQGNYLEYKPGLEYQMGAIPHYEYLPSWDGEEVARAKTMEELPENAKKYLAFIQARIGVPIVIATTGPQRENMVDFPPTMNTRGLIFPS